MIEPAAAQVRDNLTMALSALGMAKLVERTGEEAERLGTQARQSVMRALRALSDVIAISDGGRLVPAAALRRVYALVEERNFGRAHLIADVLSEAIHQGGVDLIEFPGNPGPGNQETGSMDTENVEAGVPGGRKRPYGQYSE